MTLHPNDKQNAKKQRRMHSRVRRLGVNEAQLKCQWMRNYRR